MQTFIYRCPQTGLRVQGLAVEDIGENEFVSVTCLACTGAHLVNPTSAKVVGEGNDEKET